MVASSPMPSSFYAGDRRRGLRDLVAYLLGNGRKEFNRMHLLRKKKTSGSFSFFVSANTCFDLVGDDRASFSVDATRRLTKVEGNDFRL